MARLCYAVLLALAAPCSCVSSMSLREAAKAKGIFFGTALNTAHITGTASGDADYRQIAEAQYDLVTAENACKWGETEPSQGDFNFDSCEIVRNFTTGQMKGTFRGHNLCWGNYNPAWLTKLNATEKRSALQNHVEKVVTHFGDTAYGWDVVNEAVTDNGGAKDPLKSSDWYPDVPDYIDVAFKAARAAADAAGAKDLKLFYNDYNIASMSGFSATKSQRVYDLVAGMQKRGVPIDGVGLQLHVQIDYSDFDGVQKNMERLAALGLEVHVTELDVSTKGTSWSSALDEQQAQVYVGLLKACLAVPACKSFETWGFTDASTWKGSNHYPLPFDAQYKPKAAAQAMLDVLTGAPVPAPTPASPTPAPAPTPGRSYETLSKTCVNAVAMSDKLSVGSVAECLSKCDANDGCVAVDTDGSDCYLKSHCEGEPGACSGWCGHRVTP